jgi:cyanophycinase
MKFLSILIFFISTHSWSIEYYRTGNSLDVERMTKSVMCLAGGGDDEAWIDGWKELLRAANGGDVLIIRSDNRRGGYEDWIFNDSSNLNLPRVNSVSTLVFSNAKEANLKRIVNIVNKSELIFFAGGDQSDYINYFKNSKLLKAIETAIKLKRIPVGGTSAGMAFMGGIDYTANYNSPADNESNVSASDVLNNPKGKFVDLENDVFIPPFMNNIVTDTHFSERDRQGRLLGFMARAVFNGYIDSSNPDIKGIGADEGTAFCYNELGVGKVFGSGSVFFAKGKHPTNFMENKNILIWNNLENSLSVYELNSKDENSFFNIVNWYGRGGRNLKWWVEFSINDVPEFKTSY